MKQHYIYLTTNIINDMKYIGKHYGELDDSYLGSGKILKRAIDKYGKENFTKSILYISNNNEENNEKEKYFITLYNAVSNPLFYNIHEGGEGGNTIAGYTEEEKEALKRKLSELNRGKNNGMYGKHHTIESKQKMSINSIGKTLGNKNGMYGKKGNKAINGKKIAMYDTNNNLIQIFNAKTAVLEFLGLKGHTQLDKAIKENTLYKGYYWKQINKD